MKPQENPLTGGDPTGNVVFIAIPEVTFIALNAEAAERGMNVAQLLAQAIGVVLKSP
jgi:hypothetical protein